MWLPWGTPDRTENLLDWEPIALTNFSLPVKYGDEGAACRLEFNQFFLNSSDLYQMYMYGHIKTCYTITYGGLFM
jgi:hypothetical protein